MKKSILFNQNFLRDPRLVSKLVRLANFGPNDIVYEIGPGRGIITRELAKTAGKVVAVELDRRLAEKLQLDFSGNNQVKILNVDWLNFSVPEKDYKIFSNIPFNLTAKIVRKLVESPRPPQASYLVMQKEAAQKFCGLPRSTQFSVLYQPWFEFKVVWQFRRSDFIPKPKVDASLLKIITRPQALIPAEAKPDYFWFIELGFTRWRKNLGKNFKHVFTYRQWRRLSHDLKFPLHAQPGDLNFTQWLGIFKFYLVIK